MKLEFGLTSVGGILRDWHGGWILGYNRNLSYKCRIMGILDGLKLLKNRKYDGMSIKTES
ncbi:hypothetical protein Golob_012559 [Gossypium lobatum]|uniref:RNase H type-1 domain-containing protein n=1 Tax=Gossypium lobatum TaxID=34289 RepID=A0A7J8LLR8_9ROSI|nr:hypothetical protein [Gossypium lobatum]